MGETGDRNPARTMAPGLRATMTGFDLSVFEVWLRYATFGGTASPCEVDALLNDALTPAPAERLMLNHAVWELATFPADAT